MKKIIIIILLLSSLQTSIFAQSSQKCVLVFSARGVSLFPNYSFTGHAFVSWINLKNNHSTLDTTTTLGLFPEKNARFTDMLRGLPSRIVAGFSSNSKQMLSDHVSVEVDSATWLATMQKAQHCEGQAYSLLTNNCVSFMDAIAKNAGLATPSSHNKYGLPRYPKNYLKKLLHLNKDKVKIVSME